MLKKIYKTSLIAVSTALFSVPAFAQDKDWHKPITTYADNLLGGLQTTVTIVGGLVIVGLFGWGFIVKNVGLYKWALGGVAIVVLAQLAPTLLNLLTSITP